MRMRGTFAALRYRTMKKDPYTFEAMRYDTSLLKSCGDDVFVSASVEIRRPSLIELGSHIAIDSGFFITTAAKLGNYIHIGPYVCVIGGPTGVFTMGNFTNIAVGGRVVCVSDTFRGDGLISAPGIPKGSVRLNVAPVVLEDFANVGANVTILPGVTVREGSVIGAGSVVTKSTEPWTVYVGAPAKPLKKRPKAAMLAFAKELGYPFTQ